MGVSLNQLIQFYLNNTLNPRPLSTQIISCSTHKMAVVSWTCIMWRHFTLCISENYKLYLLTCWLTDWLTYLLTYYISCRATTTLRIDWLRRNYDGQCSVSSQRIYSSAAAFALQLSSLQFGSCAVNVPLELPRWRLGLSRLGTAV